jgi:hypothetical protein
MRLGIAGFRFIRVLPPIYLSERSRNAHYPPGIKAGPVQGYLMHGAHDVSPFGHFTLLPPGSRCTLE